MTCTFLPLFLRIFCLIILLGITFFQLRFGLILQNGTSKDQVADPRSTYLHNPWMLTWYAEHNLTEKAILAEVEALYRQALIADPLFIPAWLGLAELRYDQGDKPTANAILDLVDHYTLDVQRWRWDKALAAYRFQRIDILAKDLTFIIREMPGKVQDDAQRLAFSLWKNPSDLVEALGKETSATLFRYAVRTYKTKEAVDLWTQLRMQGVEQVKEDVLAFLDLLIANQQLSSAVKIWKTCFNHDNMLYNGEFDQEPRQNGFDWRIEKVKGTTWSIENPSNDQPLRALKLHFNQQENIDYHNAYQIVPVQGGERYLMTGLWKGENLTTDQTPFVEVYGYECSLSQARTNMIPPNQPWQQFELPFHAPEDCLAVVVRIRRAPSIRIDNQLGGTFRITRLAINPASKKSTSRDMD